MATQATYELSGFRVFQELSKMLLDSGPFAILELDELGFLETLLPEVHDMKGVAQNPAFHAEGDVYNHTMCVLSEVWVEYEDNLVLMLAALLHDVGKLKATITDDNGDISSPGHEVVSAEMARAIFGRLSVDTRSIEEVAWLCANHMRAHHLPGMRASKAARLFDHPSWDNLFALLKADCLGRAPQKDTYLNVEALYLAHKANHKVPVTSGLKLLGIDGEAIMAHFSLAQGPMVGKVLARCHDVYAEDASLTKEQILNKVEC